ncbi:hypothetical protein LMH87_009801 [Akanthomyces muscarius]|uniref:RAVE complex protein Rav1 C-terminal domain-containing protein n=1 Tax=Akanthomyces muscarius TaxID=2231603 RepID=A0A9W8UJW4_AKAMU|nr:hypothetical protein LMH87_009801 [Akanthomyces muscarius]KAJ4153309.1 hypothetical protein LMH87_009801 [Akanthomyces muscarius]
MSAVLPGKPRSRLQGLASGSWANRHVNAYITGSALTILDDPQKVVQTIYDDNDDELEAIAFDDASGKIAVCTTDSIRVYRPSARPEDPFKWALEASFETPRAATGESFALSWGREEELLAASSSLSLYSTKAEIRCSWQKALPNRAKVASLSADSAYIASISDHDKLPKVWRRLAYGRDEVRFDHSYLPHPDVVTMVRWRKPLHVDQSATNVLYTLCLDGLVRIWTPTETADGQHWQLWGSIDINEPTRDPANDPSSWIVCIIDGREFMPCVEHLVQVRMSDDPTTDEVAMEHLVAVANKTPEICLAINRNGTMSAWALDNVGNNMPEGDRVFNIAQVRSPAFETLGGFRTSSEAYHIEVQSYFDKKTGGSRLEFEQDYDTHNVIQDLDWTSTPDGSAWAQIREISIRELTPHPIGDSTWLGDGHLVIGAGNQLFVQDRLVSSDDANSLDIRLPQRRDGSWDIFEAVQRFNGPLPIFHPQFLSQCVLSGKVMLVGRILKALHKALKYLVPGEPVDDYVGLDVTEIYGETHTTAPISKKGQVQYLNSDIGDDDDEEEPFRETTAASINEVLKKVRIPQLSGHEQIQLMDMIECAAFVEKHRRSMDENGARFMLFFRQHALRKGRTSEIMLSWREMNWAYHSTTQDILVDFVARQTHGPMLWKHARESGLFMWMTDVSAMRAQFEIVARNEYTNSEIKSPVDCSLFYLALKKKTVLQGLWRMATGNKEQAATQRLLLNNFEEDKWKTVAQKNAYALLSKRRFQYAAAFFLLAGRLDDTVDICLHRLKDMQLAIAVARVYEGDRGPVLRRLLQDEVLPLAAQEGDRWLASWAFWMLGRKDMAVRALITPVYTLLETPCSPDFRSRLFLTDDPALIVLYGQLRHKSLQTLRGASKVNPRIEWEFVLHSAKLYDRMGCDLLGLDLVRNWEFQQPSLAGIGGEVNPLKLLRRRSSLVVNDLPLMQLQTGVPSLKEGHSKKEARAPTTFEEPDAGSLLDSFGL